MSLLALALLLQPIHEEYRPVNYAVDFVAQAYDLDPDLVNAIVYVESNHNPAAKRCSKTCDYGLGQINQLWVKHWGLSRQALVTDPHYNLNVAGRILTDLRDRHPKEPNWWSRYHSATPRFRAIYEKKVRRALEKKPWQPVNLGSDKEPHDATQLPSAARLPIS